MGLRCRLLQPLTHLLRACRREDGVGPQSLLEPWPSSCPLDLEEEEEGQIQRRSNLPQSPAIVLVSGGGSESWVTTGVG